MAIAAIAQTDSVQQRLDTLIVRLQRAGTERNHNAIELGRLNVRTYTYGTSHCDQKGLAGRLIPHLLPFQTDTATDIAFEAFSHIKYQWPGEIYLDVSDIHSNQLRKGRKIMRELYQAVLPIYALKRQNERGAERSYVLPFYEDGPLRYHYTLEPIPDTLLQRAWDVGLDIDTTHICCIGFTPRRHHHTLLTGRVLLDSVTTHVLALDIEGHLDMARFSSQILFTPYSSVQGNPLPYCSTINIRYNYCKTHSSNTYHTYFKYNDVVPLDSLDKKGISRDLTPYYEEEPLTEHSLDSLRPVFVPAYIDSLMYAAEPLSTHSRPAHQKSYLETFSETLVDGTRLGSDENRVRIYGPLDPATIGYSSLDGITLRQRVRWYCRFKNQSRFYANAEVGYAFKLNELRYKLRTEWDYLPRRRGRLMFEVNRRSSTFSSKFADNVNQALKQNQPDISFDSLGIDYYRHLEFRLEHSIEVANGLMLYNGLLSNYRSPVKHGVRKISQEHLDQLVEDHYLDLYPYLRLEWTPRQFYWYDRGYKRYVNSPSPTFALEVARAVPYLWGSDSNSGRLEFDVQQAVRLSRTRVFGYHAGCGKFFNQEGEYFINYRYFSRGQYPSSWEDDHVGGTFHLLDEYWYSSSPSYLQSHVMYQTPFGLVHFICPLSRYVISERVYMGTLLAEGKKLYNELGYAIENNYFNVGFFVGFNGTEYYGCGFKFRLEIDKHL